MSAAGAKSYFSTSLAQADYYINDQELQGRFYGRLSERLGLGNEATREAFFAMCENRHPQENTPLTPRTKEERTVGYDINFHCPKSVSLLHALSHAGSKDSHILDMFQASVQDTMKDIEQDVMTRVRKDGRYEDRRTGELVWAEFTHQTARPVKDHTPDPHLHSHCFVFNATWDDKEQAFKAAQFRDIKRDMPYYQARFHKRMADRLVEAGYRVRRTKSSFEVIGVPHEVIDHFSKRTNEIGQIAEEKGITDAKALDTLGARTRTSKQKGLGMEELRQDWKRQIRELEQSGGIADQPEYNSPLRDKERHKDYTKTSLTTAQCIDHAVQHSFERVSVIPDRRILQEAYRFSLGEHPVSLQNIDRQFLKDERLLRVKDRGRAVSTTRTVLAEEREMVDLARSGVGKMQSIYSAPPKLNLSGQQAEAVRHILTTRNRVSIVRGAAGSGKTTLMKEAVTKLEQAGKKVTIVAPTAQASRGVLKDEGFTGAETVASILTNTKMQEELRNQVLWVDEAGLLGTQDMTRLLRIVEENNARLILGGDTRQHASVVRGDALRVLNTVGGIHSAEVSRIYRQRNEAYRSAVDDLSKGDVRTAFDKLDKMGAIEVVDPLNPNDALVRDYVDIVKKGKSALVISPTHKQGQQVTQEIRKTLRENGLLGKKEIEALKLSNLNLTQAQKSDPKNYKAGQMIQFNQNVKGIKRGSLWRVDDVGVSGIQLCNAEGETTLLPLTQSNRFDLFEASTIAVSKGDRLHITRNSFDKEDKRLNNGQALEVTSVSKKGIITLINPKSKNTYLLDKEFGHLNHAHCVTSYASQGKTVDEVFIAQPAATFPATDAKQFYVSVSRGRDNVRIYTDDKEQLLHHAAEMGERVSAMELMDRKRQSHEAFIARSFEKDGKNRNPDKEHSIAKTKTAKHYEPEL